jgi:acyl-CoA oxidase
VRRFRITALVGLKSFTPTVAADGRTAAKARGGHGFFWVLGVTGTHHDVPQNPTVEGDNHMLPQQVVKVLLKLVQAVENGRRY